MIQTKEELFIAELGGNPQQEIELSYGAKIKITDLLSKYLEAINYTRCCMELKALKDGKNGEGMDLVKDFNKAFRNL